MKKRRINRKIYIALYIVLNIVLVVLFYNSRFFITMYGDKNITLNVNEEYEEKGAKTILGGKVKVVGSINTAVLGKQSIKYCHNNACKKRTVNVVDTEKPELKLNGYSEINVVVNGQYIEEGATAIDNYDGDISDKVTRVSNLDITKPGEYRIDYMVEDSSGNKNKVYRTINVNEGGPLSLSNADFTLNGYFKGTILEETEDKGQGYIDETIFYGDSITFNLYYYGQLNQYNVWAKSNLTPENALFWTVPFYKYGDDITLEAGLAKYKPKRVIINLGANAVAITTKEYFISKYEELIRRAKAASPETIIIVESIFPVDSRYNDAYNLNNTRINNYNYYLAEMCEKLDVYFLNTAEVLKNSAGYLRTDYCYQSDGIHLTPAGNKALVDYVRRHGI